MNRQTKIVATLGPSTSKASMIEKLVRAGVNVFRLNLSHGSYREHAQYIRIVRKLSKRLGVPIGILADLPGHKLRTGNLKDGEPLYLRKGSTCVLTTRPLLGHGHIVPIRFPALSGHVKPGDRILLADGLLELKVLRASGKDISCRVVVGGILGENKGINVPGLRFQMSSLTQRDKEALDFSIRSNVDYIALSFVRTPRDILAARNIMAWKKKRIPIVAKIETAEALKHIEAILKESDGIMIARGDLGVELPPQDIPVVQKELIHLAAKMAVPVITATQMLDSMVQNPRPTRAETTDVANAIWDGTDAVMLSAETATGRYPIETVKTMSRIIEQAEAHPGFRWVLEKPLEPTTDAASILLAATSVCKLNLHKAIVTYTKTGATAIALSKLRPQVPVFAVTPDPKTYRRLSMVWGVRAYVSGQGRSVDQMIQLGDEVLVRKGALKRKDRVVLVAGTRLLSGATNLLKIHQIGEVLS